MPGLVGMVPKRYDPNGRLLERMIKAITHRKFHRTEKYSGPFFGIGRVHLGIFNPEPQPVFNEDHSLCVFMDGKIYDYKKETKILKSKGHRIIGGDLDFCVHSYEEFGKDFARKLNGCFVIIICNLKKKCLLVVNDRYGFRPLYFSCNDHKLLFSSEVKAILEDDKFKREVNDEAVADFFAFGQLLGDKTFFKGINVLPPASMLVYERGEVSVEQYWNLEYTEDYAIPEVDLVDQLIEAMKKSVDKRVSGDNRYGISLSGGLDSRSIIGAVNKDRRNTITTYTYGPPGNDEEKVARIVAKKAGMSHNVIWFEDPGSFVSYAEDAVYLTDGMDFLTIGYIPYVYNKMRHYIDVTLVSPMGSYVFGGDFLDLHVLKADDEGELLGILYRKMIQRGIESEELLAKLFAKRYYTRIKDMPLNSLRKCLKKTSAKHPGNRIGQFLIQNVVNRLNIMGHVLRRNYVEDAQPFYDNGFFEIVLKIPPELRINHRIYVKFLKKLSPELGRILYQRTMIPASAPLILWRPAWGIQVIKEMIKRQIWKLSKGRIFLPSKRSYINPDELFRVNKEWRKFIRETLLDENSMSGKYFNKKYVEAIIQEHESGKADHSQRIILLATFELFLRLFFRPTFQVGDT